MSKTMGKAVVKYDPLRHSRKMFSFITGTWNPVTGCTHDCTYCWARRLANRISYLPKYRNGFTPTIHENELRPGPAAGGRKSFFPGETIFVTDMGDLLCDGVPDEWVNRVLDRISCFPKTTFLILTKNPKRILKLSGSRRLPANIVFGATVESDINYKGISRAPKQEDRLKAMKKLREKGVGPRLICVEPIMRFTNKFARKILEAGPSMVAVGYDNYDNKLPEPSLEETLALIKTLRENGVTVYEKTLREPWPRPGGEKGE